MYFARCQFPYLRVCEFFVFSSDEDGLHHGARFSVVRFEIAQQFIAARKDFVRKPAAFVFQLVDAARLFHCVIGGPQVQPCDFRRLERKVPPLQSAPGVAPDADAPPARSADVLRVFFEAVRWI